MKPEDIVLYSSLAVMCGSLIVIFGAVLHNQYSYHSSVSSVIHLHYSVLLIILVGVAIAAIGTLGLIYGALQRHL
jgi:hypothetical protein